MKKISFLLIILLVFGLVCSNFAISKVDALNIFKKNNPQQFEKIVFMIGNQSDAPAAFKNIQVMDNSILISFANSETLISLNSIIFIGFNFNTKTIRIKMAQ